VVKKRVRALDWFDASEFIRRAESPFPNEVTRHSTTLRLPSHPGETTNVTETSWDGKREAAAHQVKV